MANKFFTIEGRITAWRRAVWSQRFSGRVFEALGAMWLIAEIVDRFSKKFLEGIVAAIGQDQVIPFVLAISMIFALWHVRPVLEKRICVQDIDTFVSVVVADISKADHAIVVSAGQFFDTSEKVISESSLQGKISKIQFGSVAEIDQALNQALEPWGPARDDDPARIGKRDRYPIGTAAKIKMNNGRSAYFLAMSDVHPGGGASSDVVMIQTALAGLWERLGTHGDFEGILGIAIIGSGAGRLPISRFHIFREIVDSFLAASTQKKICDELRIFLYPGDVRNKNIRLDDFFDYLSNEERFRRPNYSATPLRRAIPES